VRPVQQAVHGGVGQQRVAQHGHPLLGRPVAGQQDAASFVAAIDQIVQVVRPSRGQLLQPEVIQHQQVRFEVASQTPLVAALGVGRRQVQQHPVGGGKQNVEAAPGRLVRQGLGQVRLAHPGLAHHQAVAVLAEILAGGQVVHQPPVQRGVEVEVEGLQRLGRVHLAAPQPQCQLLGRPALHLVAGQPAQELDVTPLLGHGLLVADFQGVQHTGQLQALQLRRQLV
jgi:hypothetical protein